MSNGAMVGQPSHESNDASEDVKAVSGFDLETLMGQATSLDERLKLEEELEQSREEQLAEAKASQASAYAVGKDIHVSKALFDAARAKSRKHTAIVMGVSAFIAGLGFLSASVFGSDLLGLSSTFVLLGTFGLISSPNLSETKLMSEKDAKVMAETIAANLSIGYFKKALKHPGKSYEVFTKTNDLLDDFEVEVIYHEAREEFVVSLKKKPTWISRKKRELMKFVEA